DDFMQRRDRWVRAFDQRCRAEDTVHARNTCGLELRAGMGFPDDECPAESPLAEFNAQDDTVPEAEIGAADTGPAPQPTGAEVAAGRPRAAPWRAPAPLEGAGNGAAGGG